MNLGQSKRSIGGQRGAEEGSLSNPGRRDLTISSKGAKILREAAARSKPTMETDIVIPRKLLQQELTNEKKYTKVTLPVNNKAKKQLYNSSSTERLLTESKPSAVKEANVASVVVVGGENEKQLARTIASNKEAVKEIIPRMAKFPMQGRTIQV